jgi:hypothetical protein
MTEPAVTLDVDQRLLVEDVIAKHCRIRGWHLHVVSCRTRHVHVVVTAPGRDPDDVRDQFKAWGTRHLKDLERSRHPTGVPVRQNWWTQGGSSRWINDEESLEKAIHYVLEEQGSPTPRPPDAPARGPQA